MQQVINIDGIPGSGVSSQINLLNRYFKDLGINTLIQKIADSATYCSSIAQINYSFNQKTADISLNNGSLGCLIAKRLIDGYPILDLDLDTVIHLHECLAHKYKVTNIVLMPDKVDFCLERLKQVNKLRNLVTEIEDVNYYEKYLQIVNNLNNLLLTINLKFTIVNFSEKDSILEIHKKILKEIGAN